MSSPRAKTVAVHTQQTAGSMTVSQGCERIAYFFRGHPRIAEDGSEKGMDTTAKTRQTVDKFCSIYCGFPWRAASEHTSARLLRGKQVRSRDAMVTV